MACDSEIAFTLPRRYRLKRGDGFSGLLQQRPRTNLWFAIHSISNISGHARLGMSVTKRVLPKATHRNVAKRLIRECFRHQDIRQLKKDVVIRLRKPLKKTEIAEAKNSLIELLKTMLVTG